MYTRLTPDLVQAALTKHDAKLIHGDYGFNKEHGHHTRSGCAISLAVLVHTDSVEETQNILDNFSYTSKTFAEKIASHPSYLNGLEYGFDFPHLKHLLNAENVDMMRGFEDGYALRSLVATKEQL